MQSNRIASQCRYPHAKLQLISKTREEFAGWGHPAYKMRDYGLSVGRVPSRGAWLNLYEIWRAWRKIKPSLFHLEIFGFGKSKSGRLVAQSEAKVEHRIAPQALHDERLNEQIDGLAFHASHKILPQIVPGISAFHGRDRHFHFWGIRFSPKSEGVDARDHFVAAFELALQIFDVTKPDADGTVLAMRVKMEPDFVDRRHLLRLRPFHFDLEPARTFHIDG